MELIKNAEETLKTLEEDSELEDLNGQPHVLKLFTREEYKTNLLKRQSYFWPWNKHLSYSDCFRFVFLTFGSLGLFTAAYIAFQAFTNTNQSWNIHL